MARHTGVVTLEQREPSLDRALMRLGVRDDAARIVAATPSLRASWLLAALGVAVFATWGAHADPRMMSVVLILAPVLPVAGVDDHEPAAGFFKDHLDMTCRTPCLVLPETVAHLF